MVAIALLLALLAGVSLGALGSGGSILTLPILVYVAGVQPKPAVGMSMAIVGATSLLGAYLHWRRGNFMPRPALLFALTGIPGAYLGSLCTHLLPSPALLLLFAALMVVVGVRMLTNRRTYACSDEPCKWGRCVLAGFAVGLITGFLGVGGGFLIVPALLWLAGLDAKKAMGTSLAIIAVNSASGLLGQLRYVQWDWVLTAKVLVFSLAGMTAGISVATRTPERRLRNAFAFLVLAVAGAMVWQVVVRR